MCIGGYLTGWRRAGGGAKLSICQLSPTSSVPTAPPAAAAAAAAAASVPVSALVVVSASAAGTAQCTNSSSYQTEKQTLTYKEHCTKVYIKLYTTAQKVKNKSSPYSNIEHRVPELIPVLGSQPARDVSHKPGGRLPLLSTRPAVTPATLKRAATNFAAW